MDARPLGVTILAFLHCIGGVLLIGAQLLFLANLSRVAEELDKIGFHPLLLILGVLLLAGLGLASGIGMWLGTRWGWWCATFYYVYNIARGASAILNVSGFAEELEAGSRGVGYYYTKFALRAFIHLLILLYFFKSNVVEYFGVEDIHKGKALGVLISVTAAVGALFTGVAWLLG